MKNVIQERESAKIAHRHKPLQDGSAIKVSSAHFQRIPAT